MMPVKFSGEQKTIATVVVTKVSVFGFFLSSDASTVLHYIVCLSLSIYQPYAL